MGSGPIFFSALIANHIFWIKIDFIRDLVHFNAPSQSRLKCTDQLP